VVEKTVVEEQETKIAWSSLKHTYKTLRRMLNNYRRSADPNSGFSRIVLGLLTVDEEMCAQGYEDEWRSLTQGKA
jgi:hypothetical protein